MTPSPSQIETDIETHRAKVEGTLDELRGRLSMEGALDTITGLVDPEDARHYTKAAARQVRAHPLAFGLIGVGLALLATRSGSTKPAEAAHRSPPRTHTPASTLPYADSGDSDPQDDHPGLVGRAKDAIKGAGASVAAGLGSVAATASSVASGAHDRLAHGKEALGSYADTAGRHLHSAQEAAGQAYAQAKTKTLGHTAADSTAAHPGLAGAAALAAGVIAGAVLPKTQVEEEWIGPLQSSLAEGTSGMAARLGNQVVEAAHAAYTTAIHTAQDEGLVPDGRTTIAQKVEHVTTAALQDAKSHLVAQPG